MESCGFISKLAQEIYKRGGKKGLTGSKESGRIVKKERFAVFQYNWGKFVFLIPRADKAIAGTRIND